MVWAGGGVAAESGVMAELGLEVGQGLTLISCDWEGQKKANNPTEVWTVGRIETQKSSDGVSFGVLCTLSNGKWVDLFTRGPREGLALGSQGHWTTVDQPSTTEQDHLLCTAWESCGHSESQSHPGPGERAFPPEPASE